MMLPTSRRYIEQAFAPRVFAGLGSATAAEISVLAAKVAAGDETAEAAYKAALQSYYGKGGTYEQAESTVESGSGGGASVAAPPSEMPPPQLYAAEECDIKDGACISRNAARQQANMALMENARREFNLQVCEYNAAQTPGSAQDQPCNQFRERVPVPAASGVMQTAVCTGGQCYTPVVGDTGAVTPARQAAQKQYAAQYTPEGAPRTQVPGQTAPPRPQAGEVPTLDTGAPSTTAFGAGVGGMSTTTMILIAAAALGGILLMKGKG